MPNLNLKNNEKGSIHFSWLILLFISLLLSCSSFNLAKKHKESGKPKNLASEYTLNSAFNKYKKRYPYITLPSQTVPDNIIHIENIVYKSDVKNKLELDIYQPIINPINTLIAKNSQVKRYTSYFPLVVLVHGGGWRSGNSDLLKVLAIKIAKQGYVVATPNYRLSSQATFPAAIYDVIDSIYWLSNNHERYLINKEKVVIAGTSAGGQIASLIAFGFKKFSSENKSAQDVASIQALINIDGLTNFTSPQALSYENDPKKVTTSASVWLGGRYEDIPDVWHEASPINYIRKNSPPTLFIVSAQPRFSAGKEASMKQLKQYQIYTDIYYLKNAPHSFWLFHPWLEQTATKITSFLAEQLK